MDRERTDRRRALADEVIRAYAGVPRLPTSRGEAQVAASLAARLSALGYDADVEQERATASYAAPIGALCLAGLTAGLLAGRLPGARRAGGVVAGLAAAMIADDVAGGARWFRRAAIPHRRAHNVVAFGGDRSAERTVVVLAHHDAAPSGVIFDQRVVRLLIRRFPRFFASVRTSPPIWWPVILGPALIALGALRDGRALRRAGMALTAVNLAVLADVARRPAVPGANDNLSGVAALVCVADSLRHDPPPGVQVVLVSAGAEEALQEGVRGFARRHFAGLDPETYFINLESVGSGRLVLLEGEGPVRMRDYPRPFLDVVARCAQEIGVPLTRGLRSRNSTDSEVPRRYGFPVATIVSVDRDRLITHYHLGSDVPENVDLDSVTAAAGLAEHVIRRLGLMRA
ncbi:M28 family peptidase [Herbidospora daliensis]|uniref:M28 family peptidase n=1 Tax=Herbidospora daliensis TaxID=295585 RepID=UPI0007831A80|nr:M28 family peptidase [Herbidospora daliensis]